MTVFTARKHSEATVPHPRSQVWKTLTDPRLVAKMTPMVSGIRATDTHWTWQLVSVPVLGKSVDLHFTEAMTYRPETHIEFRHDPQGEERAGTDGTYDLREVDGGTHLSIDLTVHVDLPFPGLMKVPVEAAMQGVLTVMGAGFARAIEKHLSR